MDDDVMRIAAGLRLGVAICHPHLCRSCGADVDSLGTHQLSFQQWTADMLLSMTS